MVDEYHQIASGDRGFLFVQIPLWSMNTIPGSFGHLFIFRSDSSMVDEYLFNALEYITLLEFRFLYGRWILPSRYEWYEHNWVQIPLWSMNTTLMVLLILPLVFRFLYGRWIRNRYWVKGMSLSRSDSSMVDEYFSLKIDIYWWIPVQIPLWSMNTPRAYWSVPIGLSFRFLYGRWIQTWLCAEDCLK